MPNVAQALVKCLEQEGVRCVFGLPGEENMAILEALSDSKVAFIAVHHEQAAAFMADVTGRLTQRAGVCLSTLGPGATNLITGVADAFLDRAPLVALTGQVSLDRMHKESHQYLDIVSTFKPITKWNTMLRLPDTVAEVVRKAFKVSQMETPGPCHIDIPEDIADQPTNVLPLMHHPTSSEKPEPREATLKKALEMIGKAKFPIVLAGNGVVRSCASKALVAFAEKLQIPVTNTFMGKGVVPYDHPLSLMSCGLQARDYISCGFEKADLVVAVGYDMVEYHPNFWNPNKDKSVIHIAETSAEVDSAYTPEVEILGDIQTSLECLAELGTPRAQRPEVGALKEFIASQLAEYRQDASFPLKPQKIIADLRRALNPSDIVVSDVGAHKIWIARLFPCFEPNTCIISNGFAAMGISLPGAIAAKLVFPERRVVAFSGDGGFLMNLQELETAVRLNIPLVVLVLTDKTYGLIHWKQMQRYGRATAVGWNDVDYLKIAEGFGARGFRIQAASELLPALHEALTCQCVAVIDCPVDLHANLALTETLGQLICPL